CRRWRSRRAQSRLQTRPDGGRACRRYAPGGGLMSSWSDSIGFGCIAMAAIGCIYALVAAALLPRFRSAGAAHPAARPGVTILKPLRGTEPSLADNLRSFCVQRYDSPVQ